MTLSAAAISALRRYSTSIPRGGGGGGPYSDPHYRLKATLVTGYLISAFTLPFVPPVLETRRSRRDGSDLTRPPIEFMPAPKY